MTNKDVIMGSEQPQDCQLSRRNFMKAAAIFGGGAFLGSLPHVQKVLAATEEGNAYPLVIQPIKFTRCASNAIHNAA